MIIDNHRNVRRHPRVLIDDGAAELSYKPCAYVSHFSPDRERVSPLSY